VTPGPGPAGPLPPLVLRCRTQWRLLCAGVALALLALGAGALGDSLDDPSPDLLTYSTPPILLLAGGACAYFVARYCLSTVTLDDRGFRLAGPLGVTEVGWHEIRGWARLSRRWGPGCLRVVFGEGRRRLTIPLIYEDGHVLLLGVEQRRFPTF
jgi:hypothetical protein